MLCPQVEKLSPASQQIIAKYTHDLSSQTPLEAWSSLLLGVLPWSTPSHEDYMSLMAESEYAAW